VAGPVELRALVLDARAAVPHWLPAAAQAKPHRPEGRETRAVCWTADGETTPTPLFPLTDLRPGVQIEGPAIVEASDTSYAVSPGWQAHLDAWGNVVMERR
jgi:N-methylhydantoinase A/oxoprolinase/acetone carboxylase beta subunit